VCPNPDSGCPLHVDQWSSETKHWQYDAYLLKAISCGEQIMRCLWEADISTAVSSNLQAEFGMAPAIEGKMQHSCFS
jgi:hypothetical protein